MRHLKRIIFLAPLVIAACSGRQDGKGNPGLEHAIGTMEAIYSCYSSEGTCLLRENFPFDDGYKAGYLASEEQAARPNPYSYLWPYSGTLSAAAAIMESDMSYSSVLEEKVLPGLEEYLDTLRSPAAYSSYIVSAPRSDRFYDDNIWIGIDFTDLYLLTGNRSYLEKAEMVWKFIESGTDDVLGGGIYWCEQKKTSKNTCSNAPGAVYALKLYKATGNRKYLEQGKALYEWTRKTLLDTSDNLYFDNINLEGKIADWKFPYNSGQMIQAGVLLGQATGDSRYLTEAQQTAEACHSFFFEPFTDEDGSSFRILKPGNVWFHAVMVRGLSELCKADGNREYMDDVEKTLEYAWRNARTAEGLFSTDFRNAERDSVKWLLTQAAMAEMYARTVKTENR